MFHAEIYRYNPETDTSPYMQSFEVDDSFRTAMVLDVLEYLKTADTSLSFRRSCREGVCGSGCPSWGWNPKKYLASTVLLQAYRFIADSRDTAIQARLSRQGEAVLYPSIAQQLPHIRHTDVLNRFCFIILLFGQIAAVYLRQIQIDGRRQNRRVGLEPAQQFQLALLDQTKKCT